MIYKITLMGAIGDWPGKDTVWDNARYGSAIIYDSDGNVLASFRANVLFTENETFTNTLQGLGYRVDSAGTLDAFFEGLTYEEARHFLWQYIGPCPEFATKDDLLTWFVKHIKNDDRANGRSF